MKITASDLAETRANLRAILPANSRIFVKQVNTTNSGMSRHFMIFAATVDRNEIDVRDITRICYRAMQTYRYSENRGTLLVSGFGFSGAQDIAETLSRALYGISEVLKYTGM